MFCVSAPSEDQIRRFILEQHEAQFSYPKVGASAGQYPAGTTWITIASSLAVVRSHGTERLRRFEDGKCSTSRGYGSAGRLHRYGTEVAVLLHHVGFFSLNACRIVYRVDNDDGNKRFGFAYGTLVEHAESGEERFTVEWNRANDKVCYDILAFSRPRQTLARVGYLHSLRIRKRQCCSS